MDGRIAGNVGRADKSGTVRLTNPNQDRAPASNALGFPGILAGLNEKRVVICPGGKPYWRGYALSMIFTHRGNVNQPATLERGLG